MKNPLKSISNVSISGVFQKDAHATVKQGVKVRTIVVNPEHGYWDYVLSVTALQEKKSRFSMRSAKPLLLELLSFRALPYLDSFLISSLGSSAAGKFTCSLVHERTNNEDQYLLNERLYQVYKSYASAISTYVVSLDTKVYLNKRTLQIIQKLKPQVLYTHINKYVFKSIKLEKRLGKKKIRLV